MALVFPNVSVLSLAQESRFFDAGFNYSNSQTITINGLLTDLAQEQGVSGVWTGIQGLINTISNNTNFQPLILNGYNFGSGRIQNISFSAGNDVKTKSYTASLVVANTGSLVNFTGFYYSGIDISQFEFLQSFDEQYDFTRKENGGYSYNHSANIRFNSGAAGTLNAIGAAQNLVKTLFTGSNLGFAFYSGYTNKAGKRFYRESYNQIDNSCSFNETFDFDSYSGSYSVIRTNKYDLSQQGVITVTENGNIKGIIDPTFNSASAALNMEVQTSYSRCNSIFGFYAPQGSLPLLPSPIVKSYTIDSFNNNFGYNIGFTNQIDNSGMYFWSYTQSIDYVEGIARVKEVGSILGDGVNRSIAYNNALNAFNNVVVPSVYNRAGILYANEINPIPATYFIETQDRSFAPAKGLINYTYNFTNESIINGTNGVKRIDSRVGNGNPVYLYGKFGIFNNKEIVQDERTSTLGNQSYEMELRGERNVPLSDYLFNAVTQLNNTISTGVPDNIAYFIENASYNFRPNQNLVSVTAQTVYNQIADKTLVLK
jgi:hypothetical protein